MQYEIKGGSFPVVECKLEDEMCIRDRSQAALTRGLGGPVKRTNICKLGFHVQEDVYKRQGQTIGAAFADFAPGLALFDWLVGIVGAVAFRLLIYCKAKKAKKMCIRDRYIPVREGWARRCRHPQRWCGPE